MPLLVLFLTGLVCLAVVGLATGSASMGALAACVGALVSIPVWAKVLRWN
jgi:hypothetical protein